MASDAGQVRVARRRLLRAAGLASIALAAPRAVRSADPEMDLVVEIFGRTPVQSDRLRLDMPRLFANGYTVPLTLEVDCPMTAADHVRAVHVLAPRNPFLRVASFHFTPLSGKARVSTRIRLAEPQNVIAVADMSDGSLTMAKTWVEVEINGCDSS
jgi:sulfur-oxidizing protein SoxY